MASFSGSPGNDIFTGSLDSDTASGAGGNDSLSGADGSDNLAGGAGADSVDGGAGDDTLYSGDRSPSFNLPYPGNAYVLPLADTGSERDSLTGGDGSDRIFAGYGDNVDGGANGSYGDYLYISFLGAPSGVTADFGQVTQTIGGGVITDIENISYVQGSAFGDNLNVRSAVGNGYSDFTAVSGMDGNDTLTAGYYTGSLFGDAGDDVVDGRPSQYLFTVEGGAGADTLYTNSNSFAEASGGTGDDAIYAHGLTHGGAGNDVLVMQWTYYNGRVFGDEGDDRITAADSSNQIAGGSGADTLTGGAGADLLYSADYSDFGGGFGVGAPADDTGLEHDRLSGGDGDDTLAIGYGDDANGGAGIDTLRLSLAGLGNGVTLDVAGIASGSPFALGGGVIEGVEKLVYLRGTGFADQLKLATQGVMITVEAGAGNDVITSAGSSASVLGGAGDDRLVSGVAADTFDGGAGVDTVDYSDAASAVNVNLRAGSGAGGDALLGVESAIGTGFNDTLVGSGAGGSLSGGAGDDRLEVGARDTASLGSGADLVLVTAGSGSASTQASVVTVTDWSSDDRLQFGTATGAYAETTASDYAGARLAAEAQEAAGYNFVAVRVGSDVYVFGQPTSGRLHFAEAVRLVGTDLGTVSGANVGLAGPLEPPLPPPPPPPPPPPAGGGGSSSGGTSGGGASTGGAPGGAVTAGPVEPTLPAAPTAGVGGASGTIGGDMDHAHVSYVLDAVITDGSSTFVNASIGDISLRLTGFGFTTDADGNLAGGTATSIVYSYGAPHGGPFALDLAIPQTSLITLANWSANDQTQAMFSSILVGADRITGGFGADLLRGFAGNDLLSGGGGADTLWGGAGSDVIYAQAPASATSAAAGSTYLRGEEGDDYIIGGSAFDDIHGNQGADTGSGGAGDDWVVGGKDNDLLFGDAGGDLVYGNIGADTCVGGAGNDVVRGGQDNDVVFGGAGDDFVSGDRGDDTMTGGAGADLFHTFGDAGIDRVVDFNAAQGDRVMLDPGTQFTLAQSGGDTVVTMVGGGQMVLVGTQLSTLLPGWIFGA
jgi:Ca2+-binding RTX toxin-like protein